MSLTLRPLADCPEHFLTVATWIYQQWWKTPTNTVEVITTRLRDHLVPGRIPLTLVAFDEQTPVGTASLVAHDLDERPDLSPWLAAVYVRPEFRRRGIGSALVRSATDTAHALDVPTLYLATPNQQAFYARLGYQPIAQEVGRWRQTIMAHRVPA